MFSYFNYKDKDLLKDISVQIGINILLKWKHFNLSVSYNIGMHTSGRIQQSITI